MSTASCKYDSGGNIVYPSQSDTTHYRINIQSLHVKAHRYLHLNKADLLLKEGLRGSFENLKH